MNHDSIQHFSAGATTFVIAYVVSVIGALIGLACMSRARAEPAKAARVRWTAFGAFAIGGVGIWLMHFIAMLGFDVPGVTIRYSVPLTALSAVVAIAMVGVGLSLVTLIRFTRVRLLVAGAVAGLGVAAMHYLGMAAIRFRGGISYDPVMVVLSCLVAVVAATAAFWFTVVVRTAPATVAAGLIMGVAVTGMHYTGMAAVRVGPDPGAAVPRGASVFDLVFPVFVAGGLVMGVLLWMLFTTDDDDVLGETA
ncbi:MHYT domain-containing protein [Saccharothrix deserti]|uniref:MHYT domain-containing protein n=1 Tax=Saccharothrix deserti TaxID=2593674 RepID=UPI001EE43483|nr:MHYT domain-containing protein [Saccharothrix deserti]